MIAMGAGLLRYYVTDLARQACQRLDTWLHSFCGCEALGD